jgi:hypothetical protein
MALVGVVSNPGKSTCLLTIWVVNPAKVPRAADDRHALCRNVLLCANLGQPGDILQG